MPLPDSVTVVGLLLALLVIVSVPGLAPLAVGVNPTVTVQEPLTATVEQLLVSVYGPVTATDDTVAELVPELLTVTVCEGAAVPTTSFGKLNAPGEAPSTGPGAVPVPERVVVLVTPPAVTVRVPLCAPAAVGVKVTLAVHEPPAAIEEPQLFVSAKGPVTAMDETAAAELVGLSTDTLCAELV
jgi:hypothetical protein